MSKKNKPIIITKENGEEEPFDRSKLENSLKRSGAKEELVKQVSDKVEKTLRNGMRTSKIYRKAFDILKKKQRPVAARYSLKRALIEMGPTGYPFEYFIKELFNSYYKETYVRKIIKGKCVEHEIDVILCSGEICKGVEAKFHNSMGIKSDLKTVLYVKARFEDIKEAQDLGESNFDKKITQGMLVTNTKFSRTAIRYSKCAGLELLGWNYPVENSLQDLIEKAGVHPITALTTLSKKQKNLMLKDDLVLCKTLRNESNKMAQYGIKEKKEKEILEEIEGLIN